MAANTPEAMGNKRIVQDPEKESGPRRLDHLAHADGSDFMNADGSSISGGSDILALQDVDPALNMKMHLVNNVSYTSLVVNGPRRA